MKFTIQSSEFTLISHNSFIKQYFYDLKRVNDNLLEIEKYELKNISNRGLKCE